MIRTHHRVLGLYRFDLEAVLYSSRGAVGLALSIHAFCTMLGIGVILPVAFGWLRPRRCVTPLFLGDVGFGSMDCLHMLPEGARVCVALGTARNLAHIWFL